MDFSIATGGNIMKIGKIMLVVAASGFFAVIATQGQSAAAQESRAMVHRGHYHHPAVAIHRHHHPHPLIRRTPRM
jgi:hypothetical protein